MPARTRPKELNPDVYTRLICESLPVPPVTEADNERLIGILENIDAHESPTPEEAAFAEWLAIVIEDLPPGQASPGVGTRQAKVPAPPFGISNFEE